MTNKKISEFPVTTSLSGSDVFLINHLSSTSTVSFSTVSNTISQTVSTSITNSLTGDTVIQKLSSNFIKKPDTATAGQVLTYNGSTSTWVASAAQSFTGSNQSLTSNGYQKLPGGIIIQWGVTDLINPGANVQKTVTFPIPFPNSCFNVTSTLSGNLYGQTDGLGTLRVQVIAIINITNNSVILEHTGLNAVRAYWMAIGN